MTAVLAAFSLQDEIERYGAYAGIAAVFGLGILSLLYFAQALDLARVGDIEQREDAEPEHRRDAGV